MSLAVSEIKLNGIPSLPAHEADGLSREGRRFFRAASVAVSLAGLVVVIFSLWVLRLPGATGDESRPGVLAASVLQPLVTGNLAVALLWVWLDLGARRRFPQQPELRSNLFLVSLFVGLGSTAFCLCAAEMQGLREVGALMTFIGLPTLAVAVPLLWQAACRISGARLRASMLTGYVLSSALAQRYAMLAWETSDETVFFVVNSYLLGLAVALWLLSWAFVPYRRRTA